MAQSSGLQLRRVAGGGVPHLRTWSRTQSSDQRPNREEGARGIPGGRRWRGHLSRCHSVMFLFRREGWPQRAHPGCEGPPPAAFSVSVRRRLQIEACGHICEASC